MHKLINVLITGILLVVIVLAGSLLVPKVLGYQIYGVLSGSMEPNLQVGSVVYVKPMGAENIAPGDAITFRLPGDAKTVVTHRVLEIDKQNSSFITKGDANDVEDLAPVAFDNLVGKVQYHLPYLGYIAFYLQTKAGLLAAVGILVFIILLCCLSELTKKKA
ncbi:MAG: signal peptidase I [Clostridiales bacterium]